MSIPRSLSLLSSFSSKPGDWLRVKKSAVVSLRWIVVLATSTLIYFETDGKPTESAGHELILLLLFSNVALSLFPSSIFRSRLFDILLVLTDIVFVSGAVWLSGQISTDLYLLYFLVIMMAALSSSIESLIFSALAISVVYLALVAQFEGIQAVLRFEVFIRIPFLLTVTLFYGVLSHQTRAERAGRLALQRKFSVAQRLRLASNKVGASLKRERILKNLVEGQLKLCRARYAAIVLRSRNEVLAEAGSTRIGAQVKESLLPQLQQTAVKPTFTFPFSTIPFSYGDDAELSLVLIGDVSAEQLDYARVLVLQALTAIKNARQYQSLMHEVEKRQEVVRQLREAIEFKSEFFATISHELRTPVNSFRGFAELLADGGYGPVNTEQQQVLGRMVENANRLQMILNDTLDLAKLEAKAVKVRGTPGTLKQFAEEIVDTCTSLLGEKPVILRSELPEGEVTVVTDWTLLRHVALNLVSNAIKFTDQGEVVVKMWLENEKALGLSVRDTGIGIDSKFHKEIFEPYRQVESGYSQRFAGTGLGLAITRRQVELLAGMMELKSQPGEGSEFTVFIPLPEASDGQQLVLDSDEIPFRDFYESAGEGTVHA